jgi:hypothetical protein
MGISKKWSDYTKYNVSGEPDTFGVYEIAHYRTDEVLYIGEGRIQSRLRAHFPDGHRAHENVVGADVYRYEETGSKLRARQRQNVLLREFKHDYGRLPKYNQRKKN